MSEELIKEAFADMVASISKTVTPAALPHLYHDSATTHEMNSAYHFAKAVEQRCRPSAVYWEYQCDSGRIDAVIVTSFAWLLVEAKSRLDFGRLGSLEDQAARLERPEDSLRRYLEAKIPSFKKEIWGLEGRDEIWGILLGEAFDLRWRDLWLSLPTNAMYPTLRTYTCLAQPNLVYLARPWHHLLGFKRVA